MRALTYPNHKLKPSINTTGAIRFVLISDFDFDRAPERQG
jgi:hypothetical protein